VVSTTADGIQLRANGIMVVRASRPGRYRTTLSDGTVRTSIIADCPQSMDLTDQAWSVDVQDWRPANAYSALGDPAPETSKSQIHLELDGLKAWPDIPALADVAGIGLYTTTITLPSSWSSQNGAVLDLGEVFDSFVITVNRSPVPFSDQLSGVADVSAYLHAGKNILTVRVATTLNNRLRTLNPALKTRPRQPYGLVGPVILRPYAVAALPAAARSFDKPSAAAGPD
jgi:hypothetical protein